MSSSKLQSFESFQQQYPFYQRSHANVNYNNVNNYNNLSTNYGGNLTNINNLRSMENAQQPLQLNMYYFDSSMANNDIMSCASNVGEISNGSSLKSTTSMSNNENNEFNKYQQLLQQRLISQQYGNEDPKIHHWSSITPRASDCSNIESSRAMSTKSNEKCFSNFTSDNDFIENNNHLFSTNVRCLIFDEDVHQYVEDNARLIELNCGKSPTSASTSTLSSVHNNLRTRANSISPISSANDKNITSKFIMNDQQDTASGSLSLSLPTSSTLTGLTLHRNPSMISMEIPHRSTCLDILDQTQKNDVNYKFEELNVDHKDTLVSHDNSINVKTDHKHSSNIIHSSLAKNESNSPIENKEKKWKQHDSRLNNNNNVIAHDEETIIIPLPSTKSMSSVNLTLHAKQNEHEQMYQQQYQPTHQLQQCNQFNYFVNPSAYNQQYYSYYQYYYQMMLQNQNQYHNIHQMQSLQHFQALQNYNNQILSQCFPTNQNHNNHMQSTK